VSLDRLQALTPAAPPGEPVVNGALFLRGPLPPVPSYRDGKVPPLTRLDIIDLHAPGVLGVSMHIERGEMVVVTGKVGSGKTSLLRAALGLTPATHGRVLWNGAPIVPADVLVPPHAAYPAQVPRLFSESVPTNIGLGQP